MIVVDEKQWDAISVEEGPPLKADLYGFVHDTDGNPLAASSITLNEHETTSMLDGTFAILGIELGAYTITCTKEGYKDYSNTISLTEGRYDIDIKMLTEEEEEKGWWEKFKEWWAGLETWQQALIVGGGASGVIGLIALGTRPRQLKQGK